MKVTISITDKFKCQISRAFQAPILGDATRFLSGFGMQPAVIGFEDDRDWGKVGGIRYPVTRGNFLLPAGRAFTDEILERIDNVRWKWTIYDLKAKAVFFLSAAVGEWEILKETEGVVEVRYTYTLITNRAWAFPFLWVFAKTQWRGMMKRAIKGIRQQAESGETFVYHFNA